MVLSKSFRSAAQPRILAALLGAILVGSALQGQAQDLPAVSPAQIQQLQDQFGRQGNGTINATGQDQPQPDIVLRPDAPGQAVPPSPPSRLEQIMSQRAGVQLRQFGYDQVGRGRVVTVPQAGAVQDDYILGAGDEIVVTLRGQENSQFRAMVNRDGQVVLPRLNPLSAAGRDFGAFRADLEAAVHRAYVATDAYVSVGRMRQITVLISGEVNAPGQRQVTGLSSALDAVLLAGGIKKSGSLRNIRIVRGGRQYVVDLYGVLTGRGGQADMRLADGDRVVVPLLGNTVAVSGLVRQPGIYELGAGQAGISGKALLALAGGTEVRGNYRLSVLRIMPDGRSSLVPLGKDSELLRSSEILFAQLGADQAVTQATLSGGVGLAGRYPITPGTRLSDILKAPGALGTAPYTLFGIMARKDSRTLLRTLSAFTPVSVLTGKEDLPLQGDDVIRVLSVDEVRFLTKVVADYNTTKVAREEALRNPINADTADQNAPVNDRSGNAVAGSLRDQAQAQQRGAVGSQERASVDQAVQQRRPTAMPGVALPPVAFPDDATTPRNDATRSAPLAANFQQENVVPGSFATNQAANSLDELAQQLGVDSGVLINFLLDHQATLEGAVRGPGLYFVGESVELRDLVQAAGGTINWADQSGIELITTAVDGPTGRAVTRRVDLPLRADGLANYIVKPQDKFRFRQAFTDIGVGKVTVQGELRFTGTYEITRGEHLSDLLARAGGLTNTAYPYGTVFLRRSAATTEKEGYIRTANEVEDQLIVAMTKVGNDKLDAQTFSALQSFVTELRNQKPLGRVSIVADPSVLAAKPELDPLLEAGDVIYVPQRPSTISVLGQVMQPGSYPYRAGQSVEDYVAQAGGHARYSDNSQTFVVLPDGSARKVDSSWLSFDSQSLPPGSAIVVPRDLTPLDLRQTIIDVSTVLSQFAVSVASLAVLAKQ